ncbi:MAG: fructose-1,6-bisphosphatase, partial [Candidatus Diapherotrites archaeon]
MVFLDEHLAEHKVDRDLAKIILTIADKSRLVRQAFFAQSGVSNTTNIFGEQQMELDKFADRVFLTAMEKSRLVRTVASEEQNEVM